MSPDCPFTEEDINALVDDELRGRKQRRVASHVAVCPSCRALAGGALASKRLLGARSQPAAPPVESWRRLITAMDDVDGVARAATTRAPRARLTSTSALAGAGTLLIVCALVWRSIAISPAGGDAMFLRAHLDAVAATSGVPWTAPSQGGREVAVTNPRAGGLRWAPVARALFPLDGQFIDHTLYRVGPTPVSEFTVSSDAFSMKGASRVKYGGANYWVLAQREGSTVAWESSGIAHVLAGRTDPVELLSLACARRARAPRVESF